MVVIDAVHVRWQVGQLDQSSAGDPAGFVLVALANVDQLQFAFCEECGDLARRVVAVHRVQGSGHI